MTDKLALYFGCWNSVGHFMHHADGATAYYPKREFPDIPWNESHFDGGLLENGKVPDRETGQVHWTCGGRDVFWFAFYWWDNSVDHRGASNSGFYVRGFASGQTREAFSFACSAFPKVVARQHFPLALVD